MDWKGFSFRGDIQKEHTFPNSRARCDMALVVNGKLYFSAEVKNDFDGHNPVAQNYLFSFA